jgi:guanylate kinase
VGCRSGSAPSSLASSAASGTLPVLVITGPSGAGKGTLEQELLRRLPGKLELAVSATTRPQRPNEIDGIHYWFKSAEEFDRLVDEGAFLEWVTYVSGHRYGTLRAEIARIRGRGRAPLLDLELDGALRVRRAVPGSVTIFVDAPLDELERRLRARATESSGEIGERVRIARRQKQQAGEFEYVVVNDDLERAAQELADIAHGELCTAGTMPRRDPSTHR